MKRIGIISDTHYYIDDKILEYLEECDEVWHAGDIGSIELADQLSAFKPLKAVYGNIDNHTLRATYPEVNVFTCEKAKVLIKHIVGYPGKYDSQVKELISLHSPNILIAGHSHICKVMYDKKHNLLFINPGAAGNKGFHKIRTIIRFTVDGSNFKDLEVIELGNR